MEKDFDRWNNEKKYTETKKSWPFFRHRDIFWCKVGLNIGYEQDGKGTYFERPVLILRKLGAYTFIGIPITTKIKKGEIFCEFKLSNDEPRNAIVGQIRTFDSKRLTQRLDTITLEEFSKIIKAVQQLVEPPLYNFLPEDVSEKA